MSKLLTAPHRGATALLVALAAAWLAVSLQHVSPYGAMAVFFLQVTGGALWLGLALLHVLSLRGHAWARLALAALAGLLALGLAWFLVDPRELRSLRWIAGLLEVAALFAAASWFVTRGRAR